MIATEQGGRGAPEHRGRSAFLDYQVDDAMRRLLELGGISAESHRRSVGGTTLHYLAAGQGPPMVLLHGAGGGAANWYRMMAPLGRRFSVIAVDLPGFGLSDAISPQAPLGRQVAGLIADLLNAIDVAPEHLIGTSFGGLVALRLAERFTPRTLTLIDAAGLWSDASLGLRLACTPVLQRLGVKQTRRGARLILRHVLTSRRLAAEHEAAIAEYIFASAARADVRQLARAYGLFGSWSGQAEVLTRAELAALAERTLVIWGENDRFLPASDTRCESLLAAGAQVRIIPGVGHSPNWEAPAEVLAAVNDFVGSRTGEKRA